MVFEKQTFSKNNIYVAPATNQIKHSDKNLMKCGELFNKHFCIVFPNIPNKTAEIANFHFSHCKSMETISYHSDMSSYLTGIKHNFYRG